MRTSNRRAFGQENRDSCDAGPGRRRTRPRSFTPNGGRTLPVGGDVWPPLAGRRGRLTPVDRRGPRPHLRGETGWYHGSSAARPQQGTAGFSFCPTCRPAPMIQTSVQARRWPWTLRRKDQSMPATQPQTTRPLTTLFIANTFRFAKKSSVLRAAAGSKRGGQALGSSPVPPALQPRLRRLSPLEGARHVRSHCPHRHRLRPPTR